MSEDLLLITSVVREAGLDNASGLVRVIGAESGEIRARTRMRESEYRDREDNPRGGVRGARGASIWGDRLVLANSEKLIILDSKWRSVAEITTPLFGGIHDVLAEAEGIWVTSTAADLVVLVGWDGKVLQVWDWRTDRALMRQFGHFWLPRGVRAIDHRNPEVTKNHVSNAAHINGIGRGKDGLLLSMGRILSPRVYAKRRLRGLRTRFEARLKPSGGEPEKAHGHGGKVVGAPIAGCAAAIVQLAPSGECEVLVEARETKVPNHNVIQLGDWLIYNDTNAGTTSAYSLSAKRVVKRVKIPGAPSFARGLTHIGHIGERRFLVGSQEPAAIYEIDLERETLVRTYDIGGMPNECIYAICVLPREFAAPTALSI